MPAFFARSLQKTLPDSQKKPSDFRKKHSNLHRNHILENALSMLRHVLSLYQLVTYTWTHIPIDQFKSSLSISCRFPVTSQKLVSLQMRLVLVCVQQECPYALQQTSVIRTLSLSHVMVAMKSALLGRPWYSAPTALDTVRSQNFCQQQVRHVWVKGSFTVKPWMSAQIFQPHFCVKLVRTAYLSAQIPTSVCPIWRNVVGSRGTTARS